MNEGLRVSLVVYVPPKWAHLSKAPMGTEIHRPVSLVDLATTNPALAEVHPKTAADIKGGGTAKGSTTDIDTGKKIAVDL
jgi:hypothetical protein